MDPSSLDDRLPLEPLRRVAAEFPIRELAVFGSVLTDAYGDASDVDLLVEFEPDAIIGFLTLAEIQERLTHVLGRHVDLVPKRGLKPRIRQSVLDSARVIYAR